MKLLIASDIHGAAAPMERIHEIWKKEQPDKVLLLGDLLYHGPRNDLPESYAPKRVIPLLSEMKDDILAVRGNCDAEVDQMVLPFPILNEDLSFESDGKKILLHHGHHEKDSTGYDVVMTGHTHIPVLEKKDGITFLNPGSTSIPKNGSAPSYAIWQDGVLSIIALDGTMVASLEV